MKNTIIALALTLLLPCFAMAGAHVYEWTFTAGAGGTANGTYGTFDTGSRCVNMNGYLKGVFWYDTGTTSVDEAAAVGHQMDILLVEEIESGVTRDVLLGQGGNIRDTGGLLDSTGTTEYFTPQTDESTNIHIQGECCLEIHEAGASGDGTVRMIIDPED